MADHVENVMLMGFAQTGVVSASEQLLPTVGFSNGTMPGGVDHALDAFPARKITVRAATSHIRMKGRVLCLNGCGT